MKKRSIIGVFLSLMLLSSFLVAAVPTAAGTFSWTAFSPWPSTTSQILVGDTDDSVKGIAVADSGDTIYVATGTTYVYKSTDRGLTWSSKTTTADTDVIAVAPDNADIFAYADTATDLAYVSTNGGTSDGSLGTIQESGGAAVDTIQDIAVSAANSSGINYVAVSGYELNGTNKEANVWYYDVGDASPLWLETNDKNGFASASDTTYSGANYSPAVIFSPQFASDQVMLAITVGVNAPSTTDNVSLEIYSFNQSKWNASAGFTGYRVIFATDTGITGADAADLAVGPDYLGSDDAMRLVFAGLDLTADETKNGIHRIDDTSTKELKIGTSIDIGTIDYNGSVLVAGHADLNTVRYSLDPTATTPTVKAARTNKRPGYSATTLTQVVFAGDDIFAGGTGNESAFAISTNNGESFNDISLIDTVFTDLHDITVSADGEDIYMTTDATTGTFGSVWHYDGAWTRVMVTDNEDLLVRVAPDDGDTVYVADEEGTEMFYSSGAGADRWQLRTSRYSVQDLAIEGDGTVAYVLQSGNGYVSQSTNAGFTWGVQKTAKLNGGTQITSFGKDSLLVTSDDGYVSYTTDYPTFTKPDKQIGSDSAATIASATGLEDGDFIFAATQTAEEDIYRWEIGTSTSWKTLYDDFDTSVPQEIVYDDGTLYMVGTGAGIITEIFRTLSPTVGVPSNAYFSAVTDSTFDMDTTPRGVWVAGDKIYGADNTNEKIYSYTDTITDVVPILSGPADAYVSGVNDVAGTAISFTFSWEKPSDQVTQYDLRLMDEDGNKIEDLNVASTADAVTKDSGGLTHTLTPGKTYTWKVRVDTPVFSGWSEKRTFTVETATPADTPVNVTVEAAAPVAAPADVITLQAPAVTVQAPAAIPPAAPTVTVEVPQAPAPVVTVEVAPAAPAPVAPPAIPTSMLWIIVAIGAVLVIFLMVLIMRTRRVS